MTAAHRSASRTGGGMAADLFDVLVVGGGLVGASAALGAAALGWRVALVERQRPQPAVGKFGMDVRTVALSPATQTLLRELGVWPELAAAPYRSMRVWEERGAAEVCFDARDTGRDELGWIVEAGAVAKALWQRLDGQAGIERFVGDPVADLSPGDDAVQVALPSGTLRARLLVAADGARSAVRDKLRVGIRELPTRQVAMATIARTAKPHRDTAWQRFLLDGPLALLPGNEAHTVSVVWSQPADAAERRAQYDDASFCDALTQASESRLGEVLEVDRRLSFPVAQLVARTLNPHPRVLLIGDAARAVHPLAGLGVNLGFEDVASLQERLRQVPERDPGAVGLWRTFARRRRARGIALVGFLAGLRAFYGTGQPVAHWLRNVGVRLVNRTQPLKRQLIVEAMGIGPIAERLR